LISDDLKRIPIIILNNYKIIQSIVTRRYKYVSASYIINNSTSECMCDDEQRLHTRETVHKRASFPFECIVMIHVLLQAIAQLSDYRAMKIFENSIVTKHILYKFCIFK
jgi:hypothetical protein